MLMTALLRVLPETNLSLHFRCAARSVIICLELATDAEFAIAGGKKQPSSWQAWPGKRTVAG
jgi:hypothetical protein